MKSLFLEIILKEIFIDNKERQISEEICKILNIKTFHQANTGTCYIDYLTGKHSIQIRVSNHNSNPSRKDLTADYTIDISTSFNPNNIKQYIKDEIQRIDKENLDFKNKQLKSQSDLDSIKNEFEKRFPNKEVGKLDRTYQTFEEFKDKNHKKEYIKQIDLGKNAFKYLFLQDKNGYDTWDKEYVNDLLKNNIDK